MKLLVFSGIHSVQSSFETIMPILDSENPDIVILLGDLFPDFDDTIDSSMLDIYSNNILQLNLIGRPVFVIPSRKDLDYSNIKKLQKKTEFWIRWLHNKGTIIDGFLFYGVGGGLESEQLNNIIQKYNSMAPDHFIVLIADEIKENLDLISPSLTLVTSDNNLNLSRGWIETVNHLKEKKMNIFDIDKKLKKTISF